MADNEYIRITTDSYSPGGGDDIFSRAQLLSEVLERDSRRYGVSLTLLDGRAG